MHFRNRGHSDERRRRVLIEESVSVASLPEREPATGGTSEETPDASAYSSAALDPGAYRLTDLIPTRGWTLSVLLLAGMSLLAGILSLYTGVVHNPNVHLPAESLTALDVAARGSLADWYSSFLLAVAATGSWLVFVVRRHRRDDYRGHYRIWIWASVALWWASLDVVTRLHELLPAALVKWTGQTLVGNGLVGNGLVGDGSLPWLIAYGVLLGGLALRMSLELRRCRLACAALLLAGLCYAGSVAARLSLLPLEGELLVQTARAGLGMLGHGSLLLSVVLYARYVLLEAQGLVVPRVRTRKRKPKADAPADADAVDKSRRSRSRRADRSLRTDPGSRRKRSDLDSSAADAEDSAAAAPDTSKDSVRMDSKRRARKATVATAPSGDQEAETDDDDVRSTSGNRGVDKSPAASPSSQAARGTTDEELDELQNRDGLSKAERRRLRKLQRRQQQSAA